MYNALSQEAHTATQRARWEAEARQIQLQMQATAGATPKELVQVERSARLTAFARALSHAFTGTRRASI